MIIPFWEYFPANKKVFYKIKKGKRRVGYINFQIQEGDCSFGPVFNI